ncbi:MAG TPA: response regulator, partial [Pseudomonadota bacterium]|nr:response regulator [Pseudomonadota bacterium]
GLGQGRECVVRVPGLPAGGRRGRPLAGVATPADPDELDDELDDEPPPVKLVAGPPLRVLLIEDNDDIRATLQDLLLAHGHQVDVAGDGTEGLQRAHAQRPDVALIDIGLPKLDGYQVAARFRAELAWPPVLIALSGYGQPDDRSRARAAGFDAHLVKPVRLDELLRALTDAHAAASERTAASERAAAAPES